MSGLNPFRHRKLESQIHPPHPKVGSDDVQTSIDPILHPHSSLPSTATNWISSAPSSTTAPVTNPSSTPNGIPGTPPETLTPDVDDSTSDDQSVSDPFHKDSYVSDNDVEEDDDVNDGEWHASNFPRASSENDRPPAPVSTTPHLAPFAPHPSSSTSTIPPLTDLTAKKVRKSLTELEHYGSSPDIMMAARENVPVPPSAPYGGSYASSSSSTSDVSQHSAHTGIASRSMMGSPPSEISIDPKTLISRSGNRERKPPPPPKSHHGKLIGSSQNTTPSQTTPARSANRLSFQGALPETPSTYAPGSSQPGVDYFTGQNGSQSAELAGPLRRSQSQQKRPPTPPLSRRHSQMRRSKTNPARLSMPTSKIEDDASPSSPGPGSSVASRPRDSSLSTPQPEEPLPRSSLSYEPTTPATETPNPIPVSNPKTSKRASQVNPLPPPPPPRRNRNSSNYSNHSLPPTSLRLETQTDAEDYIPHPSNASDILADLSRLQKEVDDLRGHYESRKVSY